MADVNRNGPHRAGSYRNGFRNGPSFAGATIYYPTDVASNLGGVVICPGFTAAQSSIAAWGPFFASHGIVLMTIDTNTVLDPVPTRSRALLDALQSLKAENTRAGSPLQGKLSSDKFGLAGWSMGGGGTWIATAQNPGLKTAVTLAGHNATGGGAGISRSSRVPTLMMNGAADVTILGGLGQSSGAYNAIPAATPKILYEMAGLGHFAWGTPRTNGGASGRYMMAWQKVYLEGQEQYKAILRVRGPGAAAWRSNVQ
jgi:dienelactone hydrolase